MDCCWIKANRLSPVYEKWVIEFFNFAKRKLPDNIGIFYCLCVIFEISKILKEKKEIFNHLCRDGINQYYIIWMWHGEIDKNQIATSHGH